MSYTLGTMTSTPRWRILLKTKQKQQYSKAADYFIVRRHAEPEEKHHTPYAGV